MLACRFSASVAVVWCCLEHRQFVDKFDCLGSSEANGKYKSTEVYPNIRPLVDISSILAIAGK